MAKTIKKYGLKMIDIRDTCLFKSARNKSAIIDSIIIHDTGGKTAEGTISWFADSRSKVSSHYLIAKDGTIYYCVDEAVKSWHAGVSNLHGKNDVNNFSIGIELVDDNDADPYPDPQYTSTYTLCRMLALEYEIPLNRIVGHNMIAPGRKVDPGPDFPWYDFLKRVAEVSA